MAIQVLNVRKCNSYLKNFNSNYCFSGHSLQEHDCRTTGCVIGECVRHGVEFVCKQGKSIFHLLTHISSPILELIIKYINFKHVTSYILIFHIK